jgi:spore germination protein GerM
MASRKRKKRHGSNSGCLVLLICLVVLLIVFIVEYPNIKATFEKTKFLDALKQRTEVQKTIPQTTPEAPVAPGTPSGTPVSPPSQPASQPTATPQEPPVQTTAPSTVTTVAPQTPGKEQQPGEPGGSATTPGDRTTTPGGAPPSNQTQQTRSVSLFFMKIEDDGTISSHEVKRVIPTSDAPLYDTIKTLLGGPSEAEIRNKLVSLVPKGTALRGVNMRGSTAIIDLSDAFMYNKYGIEGYTAQLKQIVYTATAFPSVHDVQILIEGKTRDYLGGEGVYIGKPLSRNSF